MSYAIIYTIYCHFVKDARFSHFRIQTRSVFGKLVKEILRMNPKIEDRTMPIWQKIFPISSLNALAENNEPPHLGPSFVTTFLPYKLHAQTKPRDFSKRVSALFVQSERGLNPSKMRISTKTPAGFLSDRCPACTQTIPANCDPCTGSPVLENR